MKFSCWIVHHTWSCAAHVLVFLWSKVLNHILEPSPNTGAVKLETKDEEGIVVEESPWLDLSKSRDIHSKTITSMIAHWAYSSECHHCFDHGHWYSTKPECVLCLFNFLWRILASRFQSNKPHYTQSLQFDHLFGIYRQWTTSSSWWCRFWYSIHT